jgi:hypothetical protein
VIYVYVYDGRGFILPNFEIMMNISYYTRKNYNDAIYVDACIAVE